MADLFGTILLLLVVLAGGLILGCLALGLLFYLIKGLSEIISTLADLVTLAAVLFSLHGLIPWHPESAFWDWVLYIMITGSICYYLLKLRLVEYSFNYTGVAVIVCAVIASISSAPAKLAAAILMPLLARACWISSRFAQGFDVWKEDSRRDYGTVVEIEGHYEHVGEHDMRKKSEEDRENQDLFPAFQVAVAAVVYFFCTVLAFLMAVENNGQLAISDWWLLVIGVVGAAANVLIDLFVMKRVDQQIDKLERSSYTQALAGM